MPVDAETGLETYPSYDKLVKRLKDGASPDSDDLLLLATVVATNMSKHMGWTVWPIEILADAVKRAAKA